jgi:hypothetical protein
MVEFPPKEGIQMGFDLGANVEGEEALKHFLVGGTYDWETRLVAFIRYMVKPGTTGLGETWRHEARRWIGDPPSENVVGAAIRRAAERDLIIKTGRFIAPRDRKSHASQKAQWCRTDVK